jgi:uncharacterized membrane protein
VNQHYLLRFAVHATRKLIWWNFAHLLLVCLVPFSTAWVADKRFAAAHVSMCAGVFELLSSNYLAFAWEVSGGG